MNRFTAPALKLVIGATMAFMLFAGPAQAAQKVPATLRVVTTSGKILVDKKLKTGTTTVKSSASAKCFGDGSTNASKSIPGPTALGLLGQASQSVKTLRPLSITNAMDFGLGVCGIGGFDAKPTGFWLLKHNHTDAMVGAEALTLKKNDVVLYYQVDDFNLTTPNELFVQAPAKVKKGATAKVRVFAYDSKGKRKPAAGAKLSAGGAVTNANGVAKVKVKKQTKIVARLAGTIPSNRAVISLKK